MKLFLKYCAYTFVIFFALVGMLFTGVFFGMRFELFNVRGSITERNRSIIGTSDHRIPAEPCVIHDEKVCSWNETPEWQVVKEGLKKDAALIQRVSLETGVSARMIAAVVVPEQVRFFTANREVFKRYFEPLKILGSLSQFSLGVSGIKEDTARSIEEYANDPSSELYPGDNMAAFLAYDPNLTDTDEALFDRLTDSKDHYYSYLYTALFIKEIHAQWARQGYPISTDAGVTVTLFNLGFIKSSPKAEPEIGGAEIQTGGHTYTYGSLGNAFYTSQELVDVFPRPY